MPRVQKFLRDEFEAKVFEDFQCPACRNFYETSLKQVIDEYVVPGKVYLIHRDFPLDMHPYSHQAARLANAAADLGQFETVERALFDSQEKWSANGKIEEALASTFSAAQLKKILDYQAAHIESSATARWESRRRSTKLRRFM